MHTDQEELLAGLINRVDRLSRIVLALAEAQQNSAELGAATGELVSAKELALRLGMSVRWVYKHSDSLGVVRPTKGPKSRLLFDPRQARLLLSEMGSGNGASGKGVGGD